MPPNTAKDPSAPTPEQALGSLLSSDQLTELAVLISSITEGMRKQIAAAFDASTPSTKQPRERLKKSARNPNVEERRASNQEETEEQAKARRLQARRERDLPEPKLQELKSDAVEFFQTWRDSIVSKVVDALNSKDVEDSRPLDMTAPDSDVEPDPDYKILGPYFNTKHSDAALVDLYPPTVTSLSSLPRKDRVSILSAMLLLVLSQGHYIAHSRILLLHMVSSLHLPLHVLHQDEIKIAQGLLEAAKRMSGDEEAKKRSEENQSARRWKVGLAGLAGAALIGVTGGLAAPLVAGAIGSVMGGIGLGGTVAAGLLGTLSSSGVIVGSLFGAYGYGMTSKMMDQYAKEVEDFAFIPMRRSRSRGTSVQDVPAEERRLRVTIGVSGWLTERIDVTKPWRVVGRQNEVFALRWELEALMSMGKSLESMVSSAVWAVASREVISRTVFASLMFAMWPIALLKLSKIVDNPFNVAKNRADKAGLVLADAIINKAQGERPVTLIGYSMGARLIYSCLMSLAERRAFGLVESAVLIGAPAPSDTSVWRAMRSVVAGRLVNVCSEKDYVLAFLYRTSSIQFGVAGLEEVQGVKGVENVDVSVTVSGHLRYPQLVGSILENIGWEDINVREVEKEQLAIKMLNKEEEEQKVERLKKAKQQRQTTSDPLQGTFDPLQAASDPLQQASSNLIDPIQQRPAPPARKHVARRPIPASASRPVPSTRESEPHLMPNFQAQPPVPATHNDTEDLISFDDPVPTSTPEKTARPVPQLPVPAPSLPLKPATQPMPFLETVHRPAAVHHVAKHDIEIELSDDESSGGGIVMRDEEAEEGITMLDPVPMSDDEETGYVHRREDQTGQRNRQQAWG